MASKLLLKFHPLAEKDLDEVLEWYGEVSTSLSKRFYIELQRNILIALEHPELYPIKYGCRKISLTRFPYLIFYNQSDMMFGYKSGTIIALLTFLT